MKAFPISNGMKYDFLVLGADGMQGRITAKDLLCNGYSVFMADLYKARLEKLLKNFKNAVFTYVDLRDIDMTINVIEKSGADVVINCAEGDWNLNVYKACLATRTHCLDLGSHSDMTEEQLAMDNDFKKIKRTAITGCGSVPGIGNVMLRYAAKKFDSIETIDAGFAWDANIKKFVVPFSIESILEEFTFPAPVLKNGRWIKNSPLKTITTRYYKSIGHQQSFLVDHAELFTFHHYFKDKGLKNLRFFAGFPEYSARTIQTLIELGLDSKKPFKIQGQEIRPVDFLTQLLKRLKMPRGYKEWENLWIEIIGYEKRRKKTILMECLVSTLEGWEDAGCNIDTGMPTAIMAEMIKHNIIKKRGSFAPEGVVPEREFFKELRERKMVVYENGKVIN